MGITPQAPNGKKKILLIDDEAKFGQMVKKNLEKEGPYEILLETQGSKALETIKTAKPDLIIMDVLMPEMRGPEIAYKLSQDDKLKKIPVVYLTATVEKGQTEAFGGLIDGMPFKLQPVLAKPVKTKDLIDLIEKNLPKPPSA